MELSANKFESWTDGWTSIAPTTYQGCDDLAFQRWFKFKEAFSPSLVLDIIESLDTKPKHILDCFGGSGTTGMVSQFLGINSTLIEVNPFLGDLIEAKITSYAGINIRASSRDIITTAKARECDIQKFSSTLPPTFVEPGAKNRWLFSKGVAKNIAKLRFTIEELSCIRTKRLLKIALGSILVPLSNARIDGKGRRYKTNWESKQKQPEDVWDLFSKKVDDIANDISNHAISDNATFTLIRGDSRKAIKEVQSPIDLAIFSPPYPNSFDYTDIYNIELWMLGYLSSSQENQHLRRSTLQSHVQCKWEREVDKIDDGPLLTETIDKLMSASDKLWDPKIPSMVKGYFFDMRTILSNIKEKLSPNGTIALVVGNSSYADILINVPLILMEQAASVGLEVTDIQQVRSMRSSSQQSRDKITLLESLVLFKKSI